MKSSIVAAALAAIAVGTDAFSAPAATAPAPVTTGTVSSLIPGEVNTQAAFADSSFPIAPDALVNRAKEVLSPQIEIGTRDDGKCLAEDFEFVAAVVGPIPKEEYLQALGNFKLTESFDIEQNFFGFVSARLDVVIISCAHDVMCFSQTMSSL